MSEDKTLGYLALGGVLAGTAALGAWFASRPSKFGAVFAAGVCSPENKFEEYFEKYSKGGHWNRDVDADTYLILQNFNLSWRADPSAPAARMVRHELARMCLTDAEPKVWKDDDIRFTVGRPHGERLYKYDPSKRTLKFFDRDVLGDVVDQGEFDLEKLDDALLRVYAHTQANLAKKGDVELFRGIFGSSGGALSRSHPGDDFEQKQVSSWTPSETIAEKYAAGQQSGVQYLGKAQEPGAKGAVLHVRPDKRDVFLAPESAVQGYWEGDEHLLLGNKYRVAQVQNNAVTHVELEPVPSGSRLHYKKA